MVIAVVVFAVIMAVMLVVRFWAVIRLLFSAARGSRSDDKQPNITGTPQQQATTGTGDRGEYAEFEEIDG